MQLLKGKKLLYIITLCGAMIVAQTYAQKEHKEEEPAPQNLKVLPKNTTGDEIHKIMRGYALSLGVRCGFCHERHETGDKPHMDFASDAKPEKDIARGMMHMVDSINHMLDDIGNNKLEHITCVSCHNGNTKPTVSVDSLIKKDHQ